MDLLGLSALFVIAELDRAWSSHIEEEGELLRKRYSGGGWGGAA